MVATAGVLVAGGDRILRWSGPGGSKAPVGVVLRNVGSPGATGSSACAVRAAQRRRLVWCCGTSGRRGRPDPPRARFGRLKGAGWCGVAEHRVAGDDRILRVRGSGGSKAPVGVVLRNIGSPGATGSSACAVRAAQRRRLAWSCGTSDRRGRPDPPRARFGRLKGAGWRGVAEHRIAGGDRILRVRGPRRRRAADVRSGSADLPGSPVGHLRPSSPHHQETLESVVQPNRRRLMFARGSTSTARPKWLTRFTSVTVEEWSRPAVGARWHHRVHDDR